MILKDRCDIIIPTCAQDQLIKGCIESLMRSTRYPYRVILIDNSTSEEMGRYLKEMTKTGKLELEIIRPAKRLGWIESINAGLKLSVDSRYVCFQNDDTVFSEGWLESLVEIFEKTPDIGIANPEWEKPEGVSVEEHARSIKKDRLRVVDTDWCRGHCFFLRREIIERIGGFDEIYAPAYYDDRDYSLKAIEAGYRCVRAKGVFVYHVRNVTIEKAMDPSSVKALMERNGRIFYKRWGYPLKIMLITKKAPDLSGLLRKLCMDQNKVTVIVPGNDDIAYEHTNMKTVKLSPALFGPLALLHIIFRRSRKRQKGIDLIFTNDKNFFLLARLFSGLLPCSIDMEKDISGSSETIMGRVRDKKKAAMDR